MIAGMLVMLWLGETMANAVFQSGKRRRINEAGVLFRVKRWSDGVKARDQEGVYVQICSYQSILLAIQRGLCLLRVCKLIATGTFQLKYAFKLSRYDVIGSPSYNRLVSPIRSYSPMSSIPRSSVG